MTTPRQYQTLNEYPVSKWLVEVLQASSTTPQARFDAAETLAARDPARASLYREAARYHHTVFESCANARGGRPA